jgi:hypothetical protein
MWLVLKKLGNKLNNAMRLAAEPFVQPTDRASPDVIDRVIANGIETVQLVPTDRGRKLKTLGEVQLDRLAAGAPQHPRSPCSLQLEL